MPPEVVALHGDAALQHQADPVRPIPGAEQQLPLLNPLFLRPQGGQGGAQLRLRHPLEEQGASQQGKIHNSTSFLLKCGFNHILPPASIVEYSQKSKGGIEK